MFRKLLGGLTSTAVVAGLVTAGAVATAAPAAAEFPDPDPSTNAVISVKIGGDRTGTSGVDRTVTKEARACSCTRTTPAPREPRSRSPGARARQTATVTATSKYRSAVERARFPLKRDCG